VWFRRGGVPRERVPVLDSVSVRVSGSARAGDLTPDVVVYPSIDAQPGFEDLLAAVRGDLETQFRGRGHDFYRIRPYEALESARHVDWKATAKVARCRFGNSYGARAADRDFLDLNVQPALEDWFEQALEASAFLVWRMAQRGARVSFRTQDFDVSIPEGATSTRSCVPGDGVSRAARAHRFPPGREQLPDRLLGCGGDELAEAGWGQARMIGPESLPSAARQARPAAPR